MPHWLRLRQYRFTLLVLLAAVVLAAASLRAQAVLPAMPAVKLPAFDVVSVKLNKSGSGSMRISTHDNSFNATNVTLKNLLLNAFNVTETQLVGLPAWGESAHFDIQAKVLDADDNVVNNGAQDQRRVMLQAMLADRFQLKSHSESAMLPVYELVVAKGGPKLKPSAGTDNSTLVRNTEVTGTGMLLASLAYTFSSQLQRIVLDKTGLTGKYDIALKWSPDDAPPSDGAPPPFFTALQEQLGLKLVPSKASIQTFVVDHVEMPSEN